MFFVQNLEHELAFEKFCSVSGHVLDFLSTRMSEKCSIDFQKIYIVNRDLTTDDPI